MSPSALSAPNVPTPLLQSSSLPPSHRDVSLSSPTRSISLFLKTRYETLRSSPPSNFQSASSAKDRLNGQIIIVGLLLSVLVILIIIALMFCFRKRRNDSPLNSDRSQPPQPNAVLRDASSPQHLQRVSFIPGVHGNPMPWNSITPRLSFSNSNEIQGSTVSRFCGGNFTIQELSIATRCFSQVNLLGESEFGSVHKGVLPNGRRIAVKGLKTDSRQGMQEVFLQEVEIISQVHHKHLVSLIGYCMSSAKRLLVYEFLPNNNLDFHLHGKDQPVMKWASRMRIAIGAAKGLAHLHEECEPSIVHLNIKASNILLDSNFEAKVADFGLAKTLRRTNNDGDATANDLMPNEISREAGYFGYLAPEYATSRRASAKADVFSYGVILLELITGWKPLSKRDPLTTDFLVPLAQPLLACSLELNDFTNLADPRLQLNYNTEEMAKMVACAAACIRKLESRRPPMSEIILVLEGDMPWSDLFEGTLPVKDSGISATQSGFN